MLVYYFERSDSQERQDEDYNQYLIYDSFKNAGVNKLS